jgi:hypothetical protein
MVRRFGLLVLAKAVENVTYPGLDLGTITWPRTVH